jgi:hypothetical protein
VIAIKRKLLITLAVFLGLMLFFTIVSRAVASFNVAEVRTANAATKSIVNTYENEAITQPHGELPVFTLENQLVKELYVAVGDKVEQSAPLLAVDTDELDRQISKLNDDINLAVIRRNALTEQIASIHQQNAANAAAAAAAAAAADGEAGAGTGGGTGAGAGAAGNSAPISTADLEAQVQAAQIEIDRLVSDRDLLATLRAVDGVVRAPIAGTVSELKAQIGELTSKTAILLLTDATAGSKLVITIPAAEASAFTEDATVTAINNQTNDEYENIPVASIQKNATNPEDLDVTFYLPAETIPVGTSVTVRLLLSSGDYDTCVPLEALHQGADSQKYVYVVEEQSTALGTELVVLKVNVNVLASDATNAALDGGLSKDQEIVIAANKNLDESSRVRIVDDES